MLEAMRTAGVSNSAVLDATATSMDNIAKIQQGGVAGAIGLADQLGNVFGSLGQQNRKAFEMAKKFNIASAIMNTAVGISKAFAMGGPLGFLTAAAVAAAGFAQVAAIRSQQYSGRALGGPVMGGTPYMVGENGPEMFMPAQSGSIVRNDQLGGEPVNVNFTINAVDARGIDQMLIERKSVITSIISDAMLERGTRSSF
jgi:phage-related minor tail protein